MIPDRERTLFLALGHAANEINAITKMLYWAANGPNDTAAEGHGRFTMELLLIRLLAGKLYESWELLRKKFFGTEISRSYEAALDSQAATSLNFLKVYFGKGNACRQIRNFFAFHYSPDDVTKVLPVFDEPLHLYMERDAAPNNLYYCSEALLSEAMLMRLETDGTKMSLDELTGELFRVAAQFSQVDDALMHAMIDRYGKDLRSGEPQEIHFEGLQEFQNVALPWFSDTSSTTNLKNCIA